MRTITIILLFCFALLSGTFMTSCNNGNDGMTSSKSLAEQLIGKWNFSKSYQKKEGQWRIITFGIPEKGWHQYSADGTVTFHSRMNGQDEDSEMKWEVNNETGDMRWYESDPGKALSVKVSVDGDTMTVLYSKNFDPVAGQVVEGEFKDVLIREK